MEFFLFLVGVVLGAAATWLLRTLQLKAIMESSQMESQRQVQEFKSQVDKACEEVNSQKELLADAGQAETGGDYDQASVLLERALRIQPRDPEILQHMAEVQLRKKDYEQALTFAVRSYDIGPRVGEICSRNWRTISVARGHLGDNGGSEQAEQRASACMSTKPESL